MSPPDRAPEASGPWIRPIRRVGEATVRILCFAHAGGGPSAYRRRLAQFPPAAECHAVQLPGRERRVGEAPAARLLTIAERVAEAVPEGAGPPWVFLGHSMGAIVAFETVRALRRRGRPLPALLAVVSCVPPHLLPTGRATYRLDDPAFVAEVRGAGGLPPAALADSELLELVLPALRADVEAVETYRHHLEAPLELSAAAFGGSGDGGVGEQELRAWAGHTAGAFRWRVLPGGHFLPGGSWRAALTEVLGMLAADRAP